MTPTQIQSMLDKYLAAELAILDGKEVRFGERTLRMEDLAEVRRGRQEWEARVSSAQVQQAGRPRFAGLSYSVADFRGSR
jgi:hypothetical protein